ncbi:MAG: glycosyltransferase [Alphaproteobacteria bacterium]|nr:glycosyltransferase [Alphaproteobacteria bacterium]
MFQLIEPLGKNGVKVIPIYIGGIKQHPIQFIRSIPSLLKLARTCDLIHAQYGSMCGFLSVFLPNKKLLSLRGSDWYGIVGKDFKTITHSFCAQLMTSVSLPFYKKVIVMSERMATEVKLRYPKTKVISLPDGIDLQKFILMDKISARRQLGLNEHAKYILFTSACRGNAVKRAELAYEAYAIAKNTLPDLQMLLAEGVDHNLMPTYINACDVTILTSIHEGWPNCIKEALACNVPFVATDVSDLRDIADKTPACKVVDADANKLSQAIIETIESGGNYDLRAVLKDMDIDLYAEKLSAIYQRLISEG